MLTRDVTRRLGGAGGASEVQAHPFFASVEWELLAARRLPAPYLPDTELVYAKDHMVPISQDEKELRFQEELKEQQLARPPTEQLPAGETESAPPFDMAGWEFVCGSVAYAEELGEYAYRAVIDM